MISVVCVYNNKKTFNECLMKSLDRQTMPYELIALDNTKGRFASAAQALNYGADRAKANSTYLMFIHQDIDLVSETLIEDAEKLLNTLPNLGIAGVAGRRRKDESILTNISHGSMSNPAGVAIRAPAEVMTVDECLIFIPMAVFKHHRFDDKTCDGWHAYAVDYSLSIRKSHKGVFVIPLPVHHKSEGPIDTKYFKAVKKVIKKHRYEYKEICSTCGCWDTRVSVELQMIRTLGFAKLDSIYRLMIARGLVPKMLLTKRQKKTGVR